MSHLSLACGKSQCSIRPTCVASVCWYVLVSCLFPLLSKCLKISQFVVFFSSYLSLPTHLLSCVELCCWFCLYSQVPSFVLWLLFSSFVFSLCPCFSALALLSLSERHWITFSVVQASCRYEGNFLERDLLWSFNFENSFQSFKFWMVYI